MLRRIGPGEVVVVATADGWVRRGRIVRVGDDWMRVAEVPTSTGTRPDRARAGSTRCGWVR